MRTLSKRSNKYNFFDNGLEWKILKDNSLLARSECSDEGRIGIQQTGLFLTGACRCSLDKSPTAGNIIVIPGLQMCLRRLAVDNQYSLGDQKYKTCYRQVDLTVHLR